jgi:hypothetical protein
VLPHNYTVQQPRPIAKVLIVGFAFTLNSCAVSYMNMHSIFDARDISNLWLAAVFPLLPLGMTVLGISQRRASLSSGNQPPFHTKGFTFVATAICIVCAWAFWWNAARVEYDYLSNKGHLAEGRIEKYDVLDGKDVSFAVHGVQFSVSCCDPSPVYRGTPTDGLTPVLVYEGMYVRLTYLNTGEIVRIETSSTVP